MSRFHFATVRRMAATSLLFVAGLPSALAYNTQDVINFSVTGNIVAGSCNVSYPATVELGTYLPTDFINEGDSTDNVPFTVTFTNCSPSLTKATVAFTGAVDGTQPFYFANGITAEGGGATDVALELLTDADHWQMSNGQSHDVTLESDSHAGEIIFIARMATPGHNPGTGEFQSVVTLNVVYN